MGHPLLQYLGVQGLFKARGVTQARAFKGVGRTGSGERWCERDRDWRKGVSGAARGVRGTGAGVGLGARGVRGTGPGARGDMVKGFQEQGVWEGQGLEKGGVRGTGTGARVSEEQGWSKGLVQRK